MTLTFYSNFLNHHQVYLADEFYKILGDNYHFVETEPMPDSFKQSGYPDFNNRPYLIKTYTGKNEQEKAIELSETSDVVIIGSAPDLYYINRLKQNQIVFQYSERWFRKFNLGYLNPKVWLYWYSHFTKYRKNRYYMLCASAYTATDVSKIFAFPNKCFKWGYFTNCNSFDILQYQFEKKRNNIIEIIWCNRFIPLKHPEMAVKLCCFLKEQKYSFHMTMIGSGIEEVKIKKLIDQFSLNNHISLIGNIPNELVIELMRESHIALTTSNKQEGWGATVNEAMSAACCVIASDKVGSAKFLIKDGTNGLLFKSENQKDLNKKVNYLFKNPDLIYKFGHSAYETMQNVWSPQNAAHNFLNLTQAIIDGNNDFEIQEGPCSKAK